MTPTYPGTGQPMTAGVLADGSTVNHLTEHGRTIGAQENVSYYGAKGDGATDDTTAIAAAYTAARSNGLPVFFPPGKTFIVSAQLNPLGTTTLGYGATVKHKGSITDFVMFSATGAFSVYGLTVDMNKANVTDPADSNVNHHNGFYITATAGWSGTARFQNVTVQNAWGAAFKLGASTAALGADSVPAAKAIVSGCTVSNCDYGVMTIATTDSHIIGNTITSTVLDSTWDYLSARPTIASNSVLSPGNHGIVTQYSVGATITGNTVYGPTAAGIIVGGGSDTISVSSRFAITGNVVRQAGTSGIVADPTQASTLTTTRNVYGTISGNSCTGSTSHGVYLQNAGYVSITGNTCQGNGDGGILVTGYRCTIVGNVCTGNVQNIGIYGTAGSKGEHRISGNSLSAAGVGDIIYDAFARIGTTVDISTAALATNAPDGFLRIPTCAGTPTGTPTAITGTIPLVYDTTNNKLYIYNGGAWKGGTVPGVFS